MAQTDPKKWRKSRVAAIDLKDRKKIIAIGTDLAKVVKKAEKSGKKFILAWIGIPGRTYIFSLCLGSSTG